MPVIEFEGVGENLITGVKTATENLKAMRSEVVGVNEAIRKQATENTAQTARLNETIEATAQSLTDVRKEADKQAEASERSRQAAAKAILDAKTLTEEQKKQAAATGGVTKEYNALLAASKKANDAAKAGAKDQIGILTQLQSRIDLLNQKKLSLLDPKQIAVVNAELKKLTTEYNKIANGTPAKAGGIKGFLDDIGKGAGDATGKVGGLFSSITNGVGSAIPGAGQLTSVLSGLAGPIGLAATAVVGLVANLTRLDDAKVFVSALGIAFDTMLNRLTSFSGIASLFDPTTLQQDAIFAAAIAKQLDAIEDKQNAINLSNADAEVQQAALNQQLRDRTKTEEERLAIAGEITRIEQERAAAEIGFINEQIQAQIKVNRLQLASLHEVSDANKAQLTDLEVQLRNAQARSIQLTEQTERRVNSIKEEGAGERDRIQQEELARRTKAQNDIAALEQDLARRNTTATQATADPLERLQRIREANKAEVEALEEKIRAANEALGRGNKLTEDQEQQLANIRLAIQAQYEKDKQALELKAATDRIALIQDAGEQERAAFDAQLNAKVKTFREEGQDEIAIARFVQGERDKFRLGQVEKAISQEEAIANARIDAMEKGAETEIEFERRKEELKLDVREEFTKARIEQIKNDPAAELERLQLEGILREIDKARGALAESAPKVDLFSLLGIDIDEEKKAQFLADLQSIGASVIQFATANIEAQQAGVQAQVDASDAIIEDQQRRRDELQRQLDQALSDQRDGFANNADAIREEIATTQQVEAAALAQKKEAIAEQKRLAQQQVKIDSAVQISALLTANARLLEKGALAGPAGVIAAIAFALSLIGTFAAIRAKVKAANSDTPQFRKGASVEGLVEGSSHEQGGIAMFDRRTGKEVGEMEGREFIVNSRSTQRFRKTIEAINEGSMPKIQQAAIKELMLSANIQLDQDKVREIVRTKETANNLVIVQAAQTDKALVKEIRELKETVEGFKTQERTRPSTSTQGNRTVVKTPARTDVKR